MLYGEEMDSSHYCVVSEESDRIRQEIFREFCRSRGLFFFLSLSSVETFLGKITICVVAAADGFLLTSK